MNPIRTAPVMMALAGLVALAAAMGIGRFILTPILPFMIESLGHSVGQAGLIASSNYLGYLIGALLASLSWFADSRRFWLLAGLAVSALTTMGMGILDVLPALILNRFLAGLASAFVMVFTSAFVLERLAESGRPGLSSLHFAGVGAGIAFSAALVWLLSSLGFGWRGFWLFAGLAACLALPVALILLPRQSGQANHATLLPAPFSLDPKFVPFVVAYGLFGFGYVITATFIVTMARQSMASTSLEPLTWIAVGVSAMLSVAGWNLVARHTGVWRAFALASLLEALGIAATVLVPGTIGLMTGAVLLGGTFVALTALGFAAARQSGSQHPGRLVALLTAAFGLGQIVGPSFAGLTADLTGSFTLPTLAAALALLGSAALTGRRTT